MRLKFSTGRLMEKLICKILLSIFIYFVELFILNYFSLRQQNDKQNSKSRSVTPSPEREIPVESTQPDLEPEEIHDNKVETPTEEELLEKEREFKEQERLRQEVANLESSIQPGVVVSRDLLKQKGRESDSSATDASGDETAEEDIPQDENSGDALKKQLLQRLAQKQAEEERKIAAVAAAGSKPTVSTAAKQPEGRVVTNEDEEMNDEEEEKVDDAVDMFAESGDEKEEKTDKLKETVVGEAEKVVTEEAGKTDEHNLRAVADGERPEEEKKAEQQAGDKEAAAPDEANVDTLKTLAEIRNRMGEMSREELEAALKNLPSKGNEAEPEDGRTTPIHLRDIVVPFKSLTEFVDNKRSLYKQVFRTINKKEFKRMLPKYLRVC